MKKLLCAIAVGGLCSAVSAVESSNVVGYITPDAFSAGYKFYGPAFSDVGQLVDGVGSYDVQNLKPQGTVVPNGETTSGAISVQKLQSDGSTDGNTLYWRVGKFGRTTYNGWYTASGTTPATMTINAGEGLCVKMPAGSNCSLVQSGEVPTADVYVDIRDAGHTCVCNPQPASVDVQTILPYAAEGHSVPTGEKTTEAICIQRIAPDGSTLGDALYWRDGKFGRTTYHGWYTASGTSQASLSLPAGEGLWVNNPTGSGITLLFPRVIGD